MDNILAIQILGNTILDILTALLIFLVAVFCVRIFYRVLIFRLKKWAEHTTNTFDDLIIEVLRKIFLPAGYWTSLYWASRSLVLPNMLAQTISFVTMLVITYLAVVTITRIIGFLFDLYLHKRGGPASMRKSLNGVLFLVRFVVWILAVVFLLDNLGFKISAVIAGLGIGGIAVALAAQAILGDLFSYFSILFDRPFEVGDVIHIGEYIGEVEQIGVKTTRIRSVSGEQLIFPNSSLTGTQLRNYKRMTQRRARFMIGVTYETSTEQLKKIPGMIENIIKSFPQTQFDRSHFASFGDFSLNFETIYYVKSAEYKDFMDVQQSVNFAIKEIFEKENIQFAYPTQTVYLTKTN